MARVLIVDDEEGIRQVLSAFLAAEDYQVETAITADEALGRLAREDYDVVISDILMPGKGGLELLELIHKLSPQTRVILITGKPTYESAAQAIRSGVFEYIAKPVTRATLLRCVEDAVNVKSLEEEAHNYRVRLEDLAERRSRQLRDWHDRLQNIADQARSLASHRAIEELAPQVLSLLAQGTLAEGATFYLRSGGTLELIAAIGAEHAATKIELPAREGSVVARMLVDSQAVLVQDINEEGLTSAGSTNYRDGSFMGLPCVGVGNQVEALIFLYNRREGSFSQQDLAVGRLIAAGAESAMRATALFQTMQELEARQRITHPEVLVDQAEHIFRTVRHEIGNALNTLKTTLSVLRKNLAIFDEAKKEEYFTRCFESFHLAEQMLHALRAFQRFDLVQSVELELGVFLSEKEGFIFEAARGRDVTCSLSTYPEAVEVQADPDAILRILINLVDNALASVQARTAPLISLACSCSADEAVIEVRDNGTGIAPEHVGRVFEPLFSTKPEGSGLGLAIVQKLMIKMGGAVHLDSTLGEGTKVELRFPRLDRSSTTAIAPGHVEETRQIHNPLVVRTNPLLGQVFGGRWELERLLGEGAMGSVFEARHVLIGRRAALKVIHAELLDRPHLRSCFLREARVVNWVNHPNIAEIYDFGENEDGRVFLVMELLKGERLSDRIARGPLELSVALDVLEQIAAALARAHDLGVVHRDLKPEHVFLVARGVGNNFVKLIDFGLAQLAREGGVGGMGVLLGTPGYIAPERLRGEEAGPAADLYALGVIFYEMVTGQPPFTTNDISSLLDQHRTQAPPDPASYRSDLTPEISRIIFRLLEKDPLRRYSEAYSLLDDCRSLKSRVNMAASPEGAEFMQTTHSYTPSSEVVSVWSQKTALLGRMAAIAYTSQQDPAHIEREVEGMWRSLSRLCRLDGELDVTESFNENERLGAREAAGEVARRIGEMSKQTSRLHRRIEAGREELVQLRQVTDRIAPHLALLRNRIEESDNQQDPLVLDALLQEAGETAARYQMLTDGATKLEGQISKWLHDAERVSSRVEALREQLRSDNERLASELDRRVTQVNSLYDERSALLTELRRTQDLLHDHFSRRRECKALLEKLATLPD